MTRILYAMWIKDPLGDPSKDVFAEVECSSVCLYSGSGEEPADYAITPRRLSLNDADLDPALFPEITQYVMDRGR